MFFEEWDFFEDAKSGKYCRKKSEKMAGFFENLKSCEKWCGIFSCIEKHPKAGKL